MNSRALLLICVAAGCAWFATGVAQADVVISPLFTDNAVLQRETTVTIWGAAAPGEAVKVSFGKQSHQTVAGTNGQWQVMLDPLPANVRDSLVIRGRNQITLTNVITGDVWLCSGQSNMGFKVREATNATVEVAAANYPDIRHFAVPNRPATNPQPSTFIRGVAWQPSSPRTAGEFTAAGYFFAREVHRRTGVPIGLFNSSWGGTPIQPWIPRAELEAWPGFANYLERKQAEIAAWPRRKQQIEADVASWEARTASDRAAGKSVPTRPWNPGPPDSGQYLPSQLYNGMIHPLIDYRIKGMLWYQGEANAGGGLVGALEYTDLLTRMIKGWREDWRGGDLPFYFVQLPNWDNKDDSTRASWAFFREGQARVLAVPKTGMAVTIDIGEHDNIHPANKQAVGSRLAAIALADTYGIAIPAQGPVPSQFEVAGGKVRIRFKHSEGGLSFTGKELNGFMLAGSDQKWHTAIAVLTGDQVILRAAEVSDPVAARYAWSNDPQANLYNGAGLPAPPFRTDDWR